MGLDYSFELIAMLQSAERLIRAVCEHLAPNDRARILGAIDYGVIDMMKLIPKCDFERGGKDICLSFLFAEDEFLTEYAKDSLLPAVNGLIQVGCVWTSFECGSRFALLRATAATTGMSRLFEQSASVLKTFIEVGQEGGALLVTFDDEQEEFVSVWPIRGRFTPSGDRESFEVDSYCAAMVASARRTLGGQSAGGITKPERLL